MIDLTLTVAGEEYTLRRLRNIGDIGEKLGKLMAARAEEARKALEKKEYPRARLYQRRYMNGLQGGYVVEPGRSNNDAVLLVIANRAPDKRGRSFSQFVIGYGDKPGGQARVHRGYWWLGRDIVKVALGDLANDIRKEVARA